MPVHTTSTTSQDLNNINISKSNDKFADFSTIASFPRECITSKMIQLTNRDESFLISCLTKAPLAIIKHNRILFPKYEKNDLIPFKPIQKLNSFAESAGALILSHGNHNLEFGKLAEEEIDGSFVVSRFCQKATEKPYKKLLFENDNLIYGKSDSHIDVYDFNRISRIGSISSKGNILDFDYCPMRPSVLAYTNGNLNIIDTREAPLDFKLLYKQTNSSGLIKWNQTVPYWIATASTNSLDFYDIRYNSSSPVLALNHSNIHSLCWSPINSDLILAASSDRRINLWSMSRGEEECRLGMIMNRFEIGSLTAPKDHNHVFYGLDDSDSLVKIKIRSEYLALIAPSHHDDSEYKDIEEALYSANYDNFKEKLTEMTQETLESGDFTKLKQLILLTTPSKSKTMAFDEKCLASIEIRNDLKDFKELLKQSTGFAFTLRESEEIQKLADQFRLKFRIVELLAAEDFESLKMFLNSITSAYCADLNYLTKSQSIKLMALLLKNDRKTAFAFLSKIISSNPFGAPETTIKNWIWMACYPTIFDPKSFELIRIRPSLSKSVHDLDNRDEHEDDVFCDDDLKIEKWLERIRTQFYDSLLSNQQLGPQTTKIIQQLSLNLGTNPINFDQLVNTSDTILGQIHAALLAEQGDVFVISAETIKLLLESVLKTSAKNNFLVEFFLVAFRLQVLTEKTPVHSGIQEFITTVGFSRLKFLINKSQDARAVNAIVRIATDNYSTLSEDQLNYLADQIQLITESLTDFSLICNDFRIEIDLKSSKFKVELQKLRNVIN